MSVDGEQATSSLSLTTEADNSTGTREAPDGGSAPPAHISLTSLAGSQSTSRFLCHLLEFDDAKILLDCGITDRREEYGYDDYRQERVDYLERLKELAPQLTLVLLSSPTIETLGLLPYLVSKCRLSCPIYATFPCRALGQLTLEEWVDSRSQEEKHDVIPARSVRGSNSDGQGERTPRSPVKPTSTKEQQSGDYMSAASTSVEAERADEVAWRVSKQDIQLTFSRITPVVYSQVIRLSGRANSPFSLLAHPSGTTLGGTLWSLRSATTDSLLYAPTFNHVKERTLDPASFLIRSKDNSRMEVNDAMKRAGILVIGSERSRFSATKSKERDSRLLDLITSTLEGEGSILMPTDNATRFLELLVLLEQHWSFRNLSPKYPLCLLSKNGDTIMATIRRLADQLGGQLGADEAERERVLKFRNVRMFQSSEQMYSRYPPEQPKLVVCAPSSLAYGLSRQILASSFISSPKSLVLFTSSGSPGSLAQHLFQLWNDRQSAATQYGSGKVGEVVDFSKKDTGGAITSSTKVRMKLRRKVYLQGEELVKYLEEEKLAKEKEQKARAMAERNRRMMEADDENDSSDSDDSDSDDEGHGARRVGGTTGEVTGETVDGGRNANDISGGIAEPGSGPGGRGAAGRRGLSRAGFEPGTVSSGPWDEFFDDVKMNSTSAMGGFDIYVRRAKHSNFNPDGPRGGENAEGENMTNQTRHRMFPFYERRRKVDGYGEYIDIEGWKTRGKAPEEVEAALNALDGVLGKRKREEEEKKKDQDPPHKFVVENLTLEVRCKMLVIDMEGKADGRALRSILPLVEPKKLVLINGDGENTQDLASALQSASLASKDIFTPYTGETVKIAEVTKSFSVRLDDSLMGALALRKIDEYEVVPVKGVIGQSDESTLPVLIPSATANVAAMPEKAEEQEDSAMEGQSDTLPRLPAPHFIGDIKLALLKTNLSAKGVPVAFHKGSLVCGPVKAVPAPASNRPKDAKAARLAKLAGTARASPTPELEDESTDTSGGRVIVKKEGGNLILEGAPGDTFYTVRAAVYDLHAVAS